MIFTMTLTILIEVILLGIALSMDAFAVSITDSLIYQDLNKKRILSIALTFAIMQALMPLMGYWIIELIVFLIGEQQGAGVANIIATTLTWVAFALLLIIGGKMIIETIVNLKKKSETAAKSYSYKEVFIMGIATSIDAFATGFALSAGISNNVTVWLHVSIILVITFAICMVGIILAKQIHKLLKGRHEIADIIGGAILICLALWIVLSFYLLK